MSRNSGLAQVEDSITNFEPSLQDKIILREKLGTLKSLDEKILDLVDDENEEESIEHEVIEASEITDKITWALVRINSTLKSLQINLPVTSNPSTSSGNVSLSPQSGLACTIEIRAKLPKLEMKKFNGRPTEWQAFIDCFDSATTRQERSWRTGMETNN